tara:strand:+ start:113 stop:244 length:132 start_codon:yes stop_codon:yes gene_type:complete
MVTKVEKDVAKPNVESVLKSVESVEKEQKRNVEKDEIKHREEV